MLAEIKNSSFVQDPGTVEVGITVIVTVADPPTDQPTFAYDFEYDGVHTARSVWITNEFADFTVTLQPRNVPAGFQMTFEPVNPDVSDSGPITWLSPGTKEEQPKPDFIIQGPDLSEDLMTIRFTVQNNATAGKDIVLSFALNVVLTGQDTDLKFTSPDPTIINVDPPNV